MFRKRHGMVLLVLVAGAVWLACIGLAKRPTKENTVNASENDKKNPLQVFRITSAAFKDHQPIPKRHAQHPEGKNISPALQWFDAPKETNEFALIVDDPDAPSAAKPRPEGPWVHWVVAKISVGTTGLAENAGAPATPNTPAKNFIEGKNTSGNVRYDGPLPPVGSGPHRYVFRLYALDKPLDVKPSLTKEELLHAMKEHVLAEAVLIGIYERK